MGYLVCERCDNYYELRPGESPDDFVDKCDCDGQFIHVENLDETIEKEFSDIPIITCPSCGSINYQEVETCRSCNTYLKPIIAPEGHKTSKTKGIFDKIFHKK
jgi:ribosomal protein L40E